MFNEIILVSVTPFSGTTSPDKNGEQAVMLQCIAGKMPNRNVLSGTVAKRTGFEIGKSYLVQVRESGFDKKYGTDFTFIKIKEVESASDIVETTKKLGAPTILNVTRPEGFEETYERKTTAVEGLRAERIKKGEYIPANPSRTFEHETASKIVTGTSSNEDHPQNIGAGNTDLDKLLDKSQNDRKDRN